LSAYETLLQCNSINSNNNVNKNNNIFVNQQKNYKKSQQKYNYNNKMLMNNDYNNY